MNMLTQNNKNLFLVYFFFNKWVFYMYPMQLAFLLDMYAVKIKMENEMAK
jgi:hypothetical protein